LNLVFQVLIEWTVADETPAFDKHFDIPIVNMEHTVEQFRAFYVWGIRIY